MSGAGFDVNEPSASSFMRSQSGREGRRVEENHVFAETIWPVHLAFMHPLAQLAFAHAEPRRCLAGSKRQW
jgi:hypothetical protein